MRRSGIGRLTRQELRVYEIEVLMCSTRDLFLGRLPTDKRESLQGLYGK
jgi:hypothetical protein